MSEPRPGGPNEQTSPIEPVETTHVERVETSNVTPEGTASVERVESSHVTPEGSASVERVESRHATPEGTASVERIETTRSAPVSSAHEHAEFAGPTLAERQSRGVLWGVLAGMGAILLLILLWFAF